MLFTKMLTDQLRETETIENEHRKLIEAWEYELSRNSVPDIKGSKIFKSDHMVYSFNAYLNKIWDDSQNMVQYEEQSQKQSMNEPYSTDSIFYTNIVALHLMKQSLQTRQEFFRVVDGCKDLFLSIDAEELEYSSSDSTVSQDINNFQKDQKNEPTELNSTTSKCLNALENYHQHTPSLNTLNTMGFPESTPPIGLNKPTRLTSSPSTPVISCHRTGQYSCSQNFSPGCNYSTYFPRIDDDAADHKLSCHFCQEALPLKKSFSVEDLNSFRELYATDDESEKEDHDDSSFEIASFYYNSDNQDEVIEREELLEKCHGYSISEKYQLLSDTEGSLKVEIDQDNNSVSSSIIHYDGKSKQIKKNKIKRYRPPVYEQCGMVSTRKSSYYSENNNRPNLVSKTIVEDNRKLSNDSILTIQVASLSKKLRRSKVGTFIRKSSAKAKQDVINVASSPSKNVNLCRLFSSRK